MIPAIIPGSSPSGSRPFYQSETDGIAAITGIYSHLLNGNTWGIQMDILFGVNHDLLGPTRVLGAGQQFMGYRWDASTEWLRVIWREMFQGINDANLILNRSECAPPINAAIRSGWTNYHPVICSSFTYKLIHLPPIQLVIFPHF